ncbi:unnamed protein product [Closterium sp. NIES-64]|nr:unnamed protein product [Closterium sp. NIES-64]
MRFEKVRSTLKPQLLGEKRGPFFPYSLQVSRSARKGAQRAEGLAGGEGAQRLGRGELGAEGLEGGAGETRIAEGAEGGAGGMRSERNLIRGRAETGGIRLVGEAAEQRICHVSSPGEDVDRDHVAAGVTWRAQVLQPGVRGGRGGGGGEDADLLSAYEGDESKKVWKAERQMQRQAEQESAEQNHMCARYEKALDSFVSTPTTPALEPAAAVEPDLLFVFARKKQTPLDSDATARPKSRVSAAPVAAVDACSPARPAATPSSHFDLLCPPSLPLSSPFLRLSPTSECFLRILKKRPARPAATPSSHFDLLCPPSLPLSSPFLRLSPTSECFLRILKKRPARPAATPSSHFDLLCPPSLPLSSPFLRLSPTSECFLRILKKRPARPAATPSSHFDLLCPPSLPLSSPFLRLSPTSECFLRILKKRPARPAATPSSHFDLLCPPSLPLSSPFLRLSPTSPLGCSGRSSLNSPSPLSPSPLPFTKSEPLLQTQLLILRTTLLLYTMLGAQLALLSNVLVSGLKQALGLPAAATRAAVLAAYEAATWRQQASILCHVARLQLSADWDLLGLSDASAGGYIVTGDGDNRSGDNSDGDSNEDEWGEQDQTEEDEEDEGESGEEGEGGDSEAEEGEEEDEDLVWSEAEEQRALARDAEMLKQQGGQGITSQRLLGEGLTGGGDIDVLAGGGGAATAGAAGERNTDGSISDGGDELSVMERTLVRKKEEAAGEVKAAVGPFDSVRLIGELTLLHAIESGEETF